jgi:hypothetical protein
MEKILIIALSLFLVITFLFWRITIDHFKKEYDKRMWKLWGMRTFYWQGAILVSSVLTVLILFLLKWATVVTF